MENKTARNMMPTRMIMLIRKIATMPKNGDGSAAMLNE